MSAIISGLKAINQKLEQRGSGGARAKWLKLEDGETVSLRFISELDADSPAYDTVRGLALGVAEHTNPKKFRRKAVCTRGSEGQCVGCEMAKAQPKTGWASKVKMYLNVYVTPKKGDPYSAIWSISVNDKSTVFQTLQAYFEENRQVTGMTWNLKRTGSNFNNTVYTLLPGKDDKEPFDYSGVEIYELDKVAIREIPYAEQHDFYFKEYSPDEDNEVATSDGDLTSKW